MSSRNRLTTARALRAILYATLLTTPGAIARASDQPAPVTPLAEGFAHPPREARPLVWWHWVSANISKDGIRADLEDMKRVGIGGAQIFDVDLYQPHGPVRYNTDAWHDHVQHAFKVAAELGLEISTMDCAGWSESAGPWITPERSMKKVVWSETPVPGGKRYSAKLPQPPTVKDFYRDTAILAIPEPPTAAGPAPSITTDPAVLATAPFSDADPATAVTFPEGKSAAVTFTYPAPVRRGALVIAYPKSKSGRLVYQGKVEASDDGKKFRTLLPFNENNTAAGAGSALTIPFKPTTATVFRVTFTGVEDRQPWPLAFGDLRLTDAYRIEDLPTKVGWEKPRPERTETDWESPDLLAVPLGKPIDLTKSVSADGTLTWDAPPGNWTVLRIGYTATGSTNHPAISPEGLGLEVDKFDPAAVAFHWDKAMSRIIREAGPLAGTTFNGVLFDSWEAGPQNWTAAMPELFKAKRGYDIAPWLPCLTGRVVGSRGQSEAFLADFRRTLGELFAENHFRVLRELANKSGLKVYAETYGGVLDEGYAAEEVDVPMAEFWIHTTSKSAKRNTSLAHALGKPVVAAEAFTARPPDGRWQDVPATLKPIGDAAWTEGINRFALHTYVHQPRLDLAPGFTSSRYGPHFGRLNTWWPLANGWVEYTARGQFLLQQGKSVRDLLYLRHDALDPSALEQYYPDAPKGFMIDYVPTRPFLACKPDGATLRSPGGTIYRAIVLPEVYSASIPVLRQLQACAAAGIPVFGPPPASPAGLKEVTEQAVEWKSLVAALWDNSAENSIHPHAALAPTLAAAKITPDFQLAGPDPAADVRFIHRATADADIYFLTNQSNKSVTVDVSFRVAGRAPELWDAVTGRTAPATNYSSRDGRTTVPLALEPTQSVFVVFRTPAESGSGVAVATNSPNRVGPTADTLPATTAPLAVAGPWTVTFQERRGAPASITLDTLDTLNTLNTHPDFGVKHFSGIATYTTAIDVSADALAKNARPVLHLGEVFHVADVRVNRKPAGVAWSRPYTADLTGLLKPGRNELTVAVANTWVNRLIGDEHLPADVDYATDGSKFTLGKMAAFPKWWNDPAYPKTRERIAFPTWRHYTKDDALTPAGLAGPVTIEFRPPVTQGK